MDNRLILKLGILSSFITIGMAIISNANNRVRSNPRKRNNNSVDYPNEFTNHGIKTPELIQVDEANRILQDAKEQMYGPKDQALETEKRVLGTVRKKRQYIKRKDYAYKTLAYLQGKKDLTPPKRKYKSNRVPRTFRVPYEIGGKTFYHYYTL